MARRGPILIGAAAGLVLTIAAGAAWAQDAAGASAGDNCGCTTPTGGGGGQGGGHHHHHGGGGGGGSGSGWGYGSGSGSGVGSGVGSGSASSGSSSSASATVTATSTANAYASVFSNLLSNASSSATVLNNAGGGGGSWYVEQGNMGSIPNLQVQDVETTQTRRICAQMRAAVRMVAIQAVCLDDKAVPHPASQVLPDRDVAGGYEGEVYRCIAGTRMQYTIGEFTDHAVFDHGQTITCDKNQALYHDAATGQLACRLQKPARDCNERSLLRRYGAGIKVLRLAAAETCAVWRTETVAADSSSAAGAMGLDGGVGGVVR